MTHVSFVPTQLYRVLHKEAESLLTRWPLLKALIVGGAACAESWVEAALAQNIPLYLTYGLSETASMICLVAAENRNAAGSVGKPLAHARIQINDQGEIMVKGHCLFNGYLEAGALKRVDQTDWFPTGDMGCLQHAELVVTGRRGYRFVCAGENIQPEAIEQCIKQLSSVEDVIVLASPDPEYGEVPIALLKLAHDQSFVRADVERLIRKELGGLYLPRRWFSLPDQQDNLKWKRKQLALMVEEGALFEFPNT
jgi:O-succinylbenzoic acid--CoA ligase